MAGILDNERWEAFAHNRAKGMNGTQAAKAAGFKTPAVDASRLIREPTVLARIEELKPQYEKMRMRAIEKVAVPTRMQVLEDLAAIRDEAKELGDLGSRMKANELIGRELGMFVTRVDAKIDSPLDRVNTAALLAVAAALQAHRDGEIELVPAQVIEHDPLD